MRFIESARRSARQRRAQVHPRPPRSPAAAMEIRGHLTSGAPAGMTAQTHETQGASDAPRRANIWSGPASRRLGGARDRFPHARRALPHACDRPRGASHRIAPHGDGPPPASTRLGPASTRLGPASRATGPASGRLRGACDATPPASLETGPANHATGPAACRPGSAGPGIQGANRRTGPRSQAPAVELIGREVGATRTTAWRAPATIPAPRQYRHAQHSQTHRSRYRSTASLAHSPSIRYRRLDSAPVPSVSWDGTRWGGPACN